MKISRLLLFISPLVLSACATLINVQPRSLNFTVSYPPKAFLKTDTNTILLINRVDLAKQNLSARNRNTIQAGAYTALKYAGVQLTTLKHVHIINLTDSVTFGITPDSVKDLAAKYHADYTLALTGYTTDVALNGLYDDGAYYDHNVSVKFTFYVGDGVLHKNLKGSSTAQSVQANFGLLASVFVHPTVGGHKDKVIEATQGAVFNALLDYLPYDETVNRPLYNDNQLAPMVNEVLAGHYDKAYTLAQPLIQDKDQTLACKAAYNMAVVYEAQGDKDDAINMAQLSMDKYQNPYAKDLLTYLKTK